jgi:hypothetical protein
MTLITESGIMRDNGGFFEFRIPRSMSPSDRFLEVCSVDELTTTASLPPAIIGDKLPNLILLEICGQKGVKHVIQKSNLKPDSETALANFMLEHPRNFIRDPIASILGQLQTGSEAEEKWEKFHEEIKSPLEKCEAIEKLQTFAKRFKNPSSVVYDIALVGDELISNALYNAPYVDPGNTRSGPDRNPQNIAVDPKKRPEIFAGCDGSRIVVGVRDHYGMLNTTQFIERIRACYEKNPRDNISYKEGGAGIGSFMIFESCASMYVAVETGTATVICCSFPIGMGAHKRHRIPKNLHLLYF